MRLQIKPSTRPGKWSAWLVLSAIVVFMLLILLAEWLRVIPDLIVSILGAASILAILAAGVLGVIAITRKKEHSVLVTLAVGVAVFEILFLAINILSEAG